MHKNKKYLLTGAVLAVAVLLVLWRYWDYVVNPWTRNGQVRAEVIQIAPRVSGPIVQLPIKDNQPVSAGDLLFQIDPRTFQAAFDQASAQLDQTSDSVAALTKQVEVASAAVEVSRANIQQAISYVAQLDATIDKNKAEFERQQNLLPRKATSQKALERADANYQVAIQEKRSAEAKVVQARAALLESEASLAEVKAQLGALGESNSQFRVAEAAKRQAQLNLDFTEVSAPVDGYVTNLNLRMGTQTVANQPALALVDSSSYWVDAYFKENSIADMMPGDRAVVTLMTYPDTPLEGRVDSIGWGIAQQDGSTGFELLPNVNPTFEWIRLAQRVPVRIRLDNVPDGIALRVGTTSSVLVMKGTAGKDGGAKVRPAPRLLQ
jgi:multidrug resistance efflux pump